jgi:hypothetical protein
MKGELMTRKQTTFVLLGCLAALHLFAQPNRQDSFCTHTVVLDKQSKIVSWITPPSRALPRSGSPVFLSSILFLLRFQGFKQYALTGRMDE